MTLRIRDADMQISVNMGCELHPMANGGSICH